jgi:hypothetical protein
LARVGRDGGDCNLLVIDGCDWEERHCCINPVSLDAKGLGTVVVGMMPPYNDCRHRNNDNNNNKDNRLMRYLALVALLSTLLCIGMCRHFRESPLNPPSASEMGKVTHHHCHHHTAVPFHRAPTNLVVIVVVVVDWQKESGEEEGQSIVLLSVQQHLAHTGNITTFHFSRLCALACFEKGV